MTKWLPLLILLLTINPAGGTTRQPFHAAQFIGSCLKGPTRVSDLLREPFRVPSHWLEFGGDRKVVLAMRVFTAYGFTGKQAAGMVGNLIHESGLKPTAKGDSGGSYGIAQWRGGRFRHLKEFAAERGTLWQDYETQLRFVIHELQSDEADACRRLREADSVRKATRVFGRLYLRPRRVEKARYRHAHRVHARLAPSQDSVQQLRP